MLLKSVSFKELVYCNALLIHLTYSKKAPQNTSTNHQVLHCSLRVCSNYRLCENQSQGKYLKKEKK